MSQINPKFNLYDIPQEVDFDGNREDVFVDDNRLIVVGYLLKNFKKQTLIRCKLFMI